MAGMWTAKVGHEALAEGNNSSGIFVGNESTREISTDDL